MYNSGLTGNHMVCLYRTVPFLMTLDDC